KHTMRRIFTSRAYQLPAVDGSESAQQDFDFVFAGPVVRRMSAEQFLDAVSSLTGVWQQEPAARLANIAAPAEPRPGEEHGSLKFASGVVNSGAVEIDVDIAGASTLWLVVNDAGNGATLDWADWAEPRLEGPAGTQRLTDLNWRSATSGYGKARVGTNIVDKPLVVDSRHVRYGIGTHANSVIVYDLPEGYTRFKATAGPDSGAIVQSADGHDMEFLVLTDLEVRSSLVPADSLMVALGRPNREQVITSRPTAATTLQALELTNGPTLDEVLKQGARKWLAGEPATTKPATTEQLVERLYLEALGRLPAPDESATASELVGSPPTEPGLADLLWVIVMLPEFQLVY
ncbi:MAG: NPCBM/NEW2 domain-containing protein, partial [Pirellulales bacterium]